MIDYVIQWLTIIKGTSVYFFRGKTTPVKFENLQSQRDTRAQSLQTETNIGLYFQKIFDSIKKPLFRATESFIHMNLVIYLHRLHIIGKW